MADPTETVLAADFRVVNAAGVTVATCNAADLAFAFIKEEAGRRGPLHVEYVEKIERRRTVRRLRRAA